MNWQNILIGGVVGAPSLLPGIIQLVEALHPKKPGQPSTGLTKFGAVVNLAQSVLLTAAAAGVIKTADAQNIGAIADLVQTTVIGMKAQGQIGGHTDPTLAPVDHTPLLPAPTAIDLSKVNLSGGLKV